MYAKLHLRDSRFSLAISTVHARNIQPLATSNINNNFLTVNEVVVQNSGLWEKVFL